AGDAALDSFIGASGGRLQRMYGHGGGRANEEHVGAREEGPQPTHSVEPEVAATPTAAEIAPVSMPAEAQPMSPAAPQDSLAPHDRVTQKMPAVAPPHERVTDRMPAVAADEPTSLIERTERATGVDKGPEYEKFRTDMADFYANQE